MGGFSHHSWEAPQATFSRILSIPRTSRYSVLLETPYLVGRGGGRGRGGGGTTSLPLPHVLIHQVKELDTLVRPSSNSL